MEAAPVLILKVAQKVTKYFWATIVRNFIAMNYQKLPKLVTLFAMFFHHALSLSTDLMAH